MERKLLSKCSPWNQGLTADRSAGHLTHPGGKTQAPEILGTEIEAERTTISLALRHLPSVVGPLLPPNTPYATLVPQGRIGEAVRSFDGDTSCNYKNINVLLTFVNVFRKCLTKSDSYGMI